MPIRMLIAACIGVALFVAPVLIGLLIFFLIIRRWIRMQ
jgi:hypothetical protein